MYKTFFLLFKLKAAIFVNSFGKRDSLFRISSIFVFIIITFNIIQSNSFILSFLDTEYLNKSEILFSILSILFFFLFLSNVLTLYFLGGSNQTIGISKNLKNYPVSIRKIVLFETVSNIFEIINIFFLVAYIGLIFIVSYFLPNFNYLFISAYFVLFLILLGEIIFFVRILSAIVITINNINKLLPFVYILLFSLFLFIFSNFINYLQSEESVILAGKVLSYFPSGIVMQSFMISNMKEFLSLFFLFLILIFVIHYINKILYNLNLMKSAKNIKTTSHTSKTMKLLDVNFKGALVKKEILYLLRSPRNIIILSIVLAAYIIFLVLFLSEEFADQNYSSNLAYIKIFVFLYHTGIFVSFGSNIFGLDGSSSINYYILPISFDELVKQKYYFVYMLILTNILFGSIFLFIAKINIFEYLFFSSFLILTFFVFRYLGLIVSFYFPRKLNFHAINGSATSLITIFIFVALMVVSLIILFIFNKSNNLTLNIIFTILNFTLIIIIFRSRHRINNFLKALFYQNKSKLTNLC